MGKNNQDKTDWTSYYAAKKSIFSTITQRHTLNKILGVLDRGVVNNDASVEKLGISVIELGGGNSCFAEKICRLRNISRYDIVDNCELAVELFERNLSIEADSKVGYLVDLTAGNLELQSKYDFVYSIGLIEHFNPRQREQVIRNHFNYVKDDGIVFITFPTPTLKYRFFRKCMEILGVWQFYDEHPLTTDDVKGVLEECGNILSYEINRKLFLTQMCVAIKKSEE